MKKILYTLIALGMACFVNAQKSDFSTKRYFGVNYGYGISGITFQPRLDQKSYSGSYTGGLTFKYMGEKYLAFQAELNYTHRGFKMKEENPLIVPRTYNSIMLPMMGQGVITYKRASVLINLGCYASYMLNSKYQAGSTASNGEFEFLNRRDRRYEFGVLGGLGLGLKLNPFMLQIESRYYYGLTNLYNPDYTNNRPYSSRQYQLQVSAALLYDLGSLVR